MSLLWIESFDHYATAQIPAKWTSQNGIATTIIPTAGRCGTQCLKLGTFAQVLKGIPFVTAPYTLGFALQPTAALGEADFMSVGNGSGAQLTLSRELDGTINLYRGSSSFLAASAVDVVRMDEWCYIEWQMTIANSPSGSSSVRVNGVEVLSIAGVDTQQQSTATLTYIEMDIGSSIEFYYDDLYVLDGAGAAPQNTFLGDVHVEYLRPTAAGSAQAWTVTGAASHWQAVDDGAAPDGDTTYVATALGGATDLNEYSATGLPTGTIYGVQANLYARKTDAGFRLVAPVVRSGGTNAVGPNAAPSFASYQYHHSIWPINPVTGVAWTIAEIDAAQFGVQHTT